MQCKHWISSDLLKSYSCQDTLYKQFIKTRTSDAWMAYRQACNCRTAKTRTAKRVFFLSVRNKPRLYWSKLKTCTGLGKQRLTSLFRLSSTSILSNALATMINNSFLARIASLQKINCSTTSHHETFAIIFHVDSGVSSPLAVDYNFSFWPVSQVGVLKLINDLFLSEATESDTISLSMLKLSAAEVSLILTKLINICISTGTFPSQWKTTV